MQLVYSTLGAESLRGILKWYKVPGRSPSITPYTFLLWCGLLGMSLSLHSIHDQKIGDTNLQNAAAAQGLCGSY